jgi:hypothetical protein
MLRYTDIAHLVKDELEPHSKHSSVTETNQLMWYREIIAVCSHIHTKLVNFF